MYLKTKILLFFLVIGLPLMGQSFTYSYIDPCTHASKTIFADMSAPVIIAYYGQVQAFTYAQLSNGEFDTWINNIYNKYKNASPCQGVITTTTTTTSTNTVSNIIGNVTSLVSLDFSSVSSGVSGGVGSNIGGTTSSGSGSIKSEKKDGNNSNNSSNSDPGSNNGSGSNSNEGQTGQNGGNSSENQGGSNGGGTVGGNSGSNNGNGNASSSGSSGNSNGGNSGSETPKEKPSEQKIEDQKVETQKSSTQASAKAAAKAKVETSKPAILMTGDIVGIQTKSNGDQDARATMSFTRVKGDGTSSIGFSADYMVNARIGNFSAVKSWIGNNKKGNKHINVISDGVSLMPDALSNTLLFVRVNSVKNFTALYGCAGTYGKLYGEEMISTIVIGGFMFKGSLTKSVDVTLIMAGIYSPYTKYYTESLLKAKPIVIPFLNVNYKITKTFGFGLTGGGTYVAGQDILNFQILMGAKLKL